MPRPLRSQQRAHSTRETTWPTRSSRRTHGRSRRKELFASFADRLVATLWDLFVYQLPAWVTQLVGVIVRVVREVDGQPAGVGRVVGRYFLHALINQVCYLDCLWCLWDPRRQALTDKVLFTEVVRQRPIE